MRRLTIVEPYDHHEVVSYLLQVLPDAWQAQLLCSESVANRLRTSRMLHRADVEILGRGPVHLELRKHLELLENADLLLASTLQLDPRPARVLTDLDIPRVLVVHDANYAFDESARLSRGILDRLRRSRWRARGWWRRPGVTVADWHGLVVGRDSMPRGSALDRGLEVVPTLATPFACAPVQPLGADPIPPSRALRIALTGGLDRRRRDYQPVWAALKRLRRPFEISSGQSLGAGGKAILRQLTALSAYRPAHQMAREPDVGDGYEDMLAWADVLVHPIRAITSFATVLERYGASKVSGSENDQIRSGTFGIYPADYPVRDELKAMSASYTSGEHLADLLECFTPVPGSPTECLSSAYQTTRWGIFLDRVIRNHRVTKHSQ